MAKAVVKKVKKIVKSSRTAQLVRVPRRTRKMEVMSVEQIEAVSALRKVVGLDTPDIAQKLQEMTIKEYNRLKQELLKELRDPIKVEFTVNEVKLQEVDHPHSALAEVMQYAIAGKNVFLAGPAGCGKTFLAEQLAKAMGRRYGYINLTGATSEAVLVGRIDYFNGNQYIPSSFVDFYENGGVFLLDEMDGADPNVLIALNTALAGNQVAVPDKDKPLRPRHKDFLCVAAANTWGHGSDRVYVGRNQLDGATLDRFRVAQFNLDYDQKLEKLLGDSEVVTWAHGVRSKVRSGQLRRIVSTRWILEASELKRRGIPWASLKARFLEDWTPSDRTKCGI